ncbi:MAG TPA: nitrate/nitrite transporter NrtS [Dehalococcoidia bacterium]|nr:nitrate/nitrite transporter NrtS [Dehalococcoidia bacterium]
MTLTKEPLSCNRCGVSLAPGRAFALTGSFRCLRCTLLRLSLLRRSFLTALIVGSIVVAINQGDVLVQGHFAQSLYWKIPLTYCVPFFVATWGALINTRT